MTPEAVTARLEGVKRSGKDWIARCPAHEDHTPSLSIGTGRDGRVLLNCHAGCAPEDIVAALGLTMADLFPESAHVEAVYSYRDAAGRPLSRKIRHEGKRFRQEAADGTPSLADVPRVLYNLPAILARPDETVCLTEGEKDADALTALGVLATTNSEGAEVPGGKSKWRPEYTEALRGRRVVILPDNDPAGQQRAQSVAAALAGVAADVRIVTLPNLPEKGDVSDWIQAGGTKAELRRLVLAAEPFLVESLSTSPEPQGPQIRTLAEILADPHALEPPRVIVPRLAWESRVTLLAAREKLGKSTLAGAAAAAVSRGRGFLAASTATGPVLWIGLEEHTADVAARLVRFGADPAKVYIIDRMESPLADYAAAIERVRPVLVVVDTLAAFAGLLPEPPDPGNSTAWTPILAALTLPARDTGAALLLLAHARKSDGRYRDSSAIGAGVDAILELDEVQGNPAARRVKARGRFAMDDFTVCLVGDSYELEGGEMSMDAKVLMFVQANPGCSKRAVRDGVAGRNPDIDAALARLLHDHAVQDNGGPRGGMSLYAAPVPTVRTTVPTPSDDVPENEAPCPAENPHGHAMGTVLGTVPVPDRAQSHPIGMGTGAHPNLSESENTDGIDRCAAGCGAAVGSKGRTCATCSRKAAA